MHGPGRLLDIELTQINNPEHDLFQRLGLAHQYPVGIRYQPPFGGRDTGAQTRHCRAIFSEGESHRRSKQVDTCEGSPKGVICDFRLYNQRRTIPQVEYHTCVRIHSIIGANDVGRRIAKHQVARLLLNLHTLIVRGSKTSGQISCQPVSQSGQ